MGASNAGEVDKNCDTPPLSGFDIEDYWTVGCRQHFDGAVRL